MNNPIPTAPIAPRVIAADLRALCERSVQQNRRAGALVIPPMVSVRAVLEILKRHGL